MNKLLLGTTALVAAGMISSGAMAADKIKLGVGGYFQVSIAAGDQDDDENKRQHLISEEGEIHFKGSTTLDNGLKVGIDVQLEAETCGDQIDEHFMWMSGGFGRIQLGAENSAAYLMAYASAAPSHWSHGVNSPNFSHTGIALTTAIDMTSDSDKITYFTPRMAGFQVGVSYTPENDETPSSYRGFPSDNDPGQQGEIIEVGVNYVNKFDNVSLAISGGYAAGSLEAASATVDDDQTQWNVGAQVGFAGFTIGGAYKVDDQGMDEDETTYNVGVRYATGPWGVGVQYTNVENDANDGELDAVEIGGSYAFGPGMLVMAGIQFWDNDGISANSQGDSTIVFLGTHVAF